MVIRALSLVALLTTVSAVRAESGAPRQPTGKWVVHFDDAQCVAERNYGSKERPLFLVLKQPPLGDVMQIAVIEKRHIEAATQLDGKISFDGQEPQKISVLRFSPTSSGTRVQMFNLPLDQFSAARTANVLELKIGDFAESLSLSQLPSLLSVMEDCVSDLKKVWNVRKPKSEKIAIREDAKGDLRRLFSSDDYPYQSLRAGETGSVTVALLVNEKGRVADCSIVETSGAAMLDAQSCAVLRERAILKPAIGLDGKPAKDAFFQKINWMLR